MAFLAVPLLEHYLPEPLDRCMILGEAAVIASGVFEVLEVKVLLPTDH